MIYNVLQYLEQSAEKYPDKTALKDEYGEVTYAGLVSDARKIGSYITGVIKGETNKPVAVLIDRNLLSVTAFFGVVYSGNFYVPIDMSMPAERIDTIMGTLSPVMVIDCRQGAGNDDGIRVESILEKKEVDDAALSAIRIAMIDEDPLYAIFTSGSTGVPKGVLVSHRSVIDLLCAFDEAFSFDEETVFCNQAPFDFDVSVKDIYNSIYCGGSIVIAPKKLFMSPKLLVDFLGANNVNTLIWAVSALRIISDFKAVESASMIPKLKNVMFSGEVMPVKSLNYWKEKFPGTRFVNLYGPTEITCNCTYYVIDRDFAPEDKIPVGKPFKNSRVLLLNENLKPVTERGKEGEICVSGRCLALGYWNNHEKTAESFPAYPGVSEYPVRIYRTGDLGYYDENMDIVFTSRRDHQIKHMGHRIELGEIETALNSILFLTVSVCIYDETHEKIVCYYQSENECKKEIVAELGKKLPKYMWPNVYIKKDKLPLNKNGKIDRVMLKKEWMENNG
ncbi:MAG: amino acid adenylation domain-containing protein [Lachnospiraceae bacterium]|nr:amino acid adenylation domain-containing protein [Lachnospiraceae bacterium]